MCVWRGTARTGRLWRSTWKSIPRSPGCATAGCRDPYYAVAQKYLPHGSCGVVSFGVKGGRAAAETFMGHLRLGAIATHVADARTCCLHPASSTHRQMNDAELEAAGVSADLVRLSVGLESKEDLIADLEQALSAV